MKILNLKLKIMKVRFRPRFFVIVTVLVLGSSLLVYSLRYFDSKNSQKVLAAATKSYSLQEPTTINRERITNNSQDDTVTIAYTVKEGDSLQSIAKQYHADSQTILDYPYNTIPDDLSLKVGQSLIIPNGYIDYASAPVLPPIPIGTGQFLWPLGDTRGGPFKQVQGKPIRDYITQYASWFHPGSIDLGIDLGTPVEAADDGTVIKVEHFRTGYGNHVIISHGDGLTSLYGHLSESRVVKGQGVRKGDILGLSGSTGRSTGPHLHFEVRKNGQPVDPMTLLSSR